MNPRRNNEAAQRTLARRQREDDAPRLSAEVPRLESLRLEIDERRGSGAVTGSTHIRRVVVENAPALFIFPCSDRDCKEGGHDLTDEIVRSLGRSETTFEGTHVCDGQLGSARCGSILKYVGTATYKG